MNQGQSKSAFIVTRPRVRTDWRGPRLALDVRGVAAIMGRSEATVRRAVRLGYLRAYDVSVGDARPVYRFTHDDVNTFLAKRQTGASR